MVVAIDFKMEILYSLNKIFTSVRIFVDIKVVYSIFIHVSILLVFLLFQILAPDRQMWHLYTLNTSNPGIFASAQQFDTLMPKILLIITDQPPGLHPQLAVDLPV